jgi:flavodoxin/NAD-dependent dihydropyrimidine dehydrogenase PreA subunit
MKAKERESGMKTLIVYYSQTGNTKKVAYAVHKGASQVADICELTALRDLDPRICTEYDLIGLGSPTWGATPDVVTRFIYSIPAYTGKHVFSFNTHGALPKTYFPVVVRRLKERGLVVVGYKGWYGAVHIQAFPSPYYTDGHPDEVDLKEAEDFGRQMVETSRRIKAGEKELIPPVPELAPLPFDMPTDESAHGNTKYDPGRCLYPKCRICMDNCPNDYIDLGATPPVFGEKFTECSNNCTFCELICPTGAIYIDESALEAATRLLGSHHGYFEKALEAEERTGNFRRLVPTDKIGWDTPYYKAHGRHPRFKIDKKPS